MEDKSALAKFQELVILGWMTVCSGIIVVSGAAFSVGLDVERIRHASAQGNQQLAASLQHNRILGLLNLLLGIVIVLIGARNLKRATPPST